MRVALSLEAQSRGTVSDQRTVTVLTFKRAAHLVPAP